MRLSGDVHPAELVDRCVDAGVGRLVGILRVGGRFREAQCVPEVERVDSRWFHPDREARELMACSVCDVESQQRFGVATVGAHRHRSVTCVNYRH